MVYDIYSKTQKSLDVAQLDRTTGQKLNVVVLYSSYIHGATCPSKSLTYLVHGEDFTCSPILPGIGDRRGGQVIIRGCMKIRCWSVAGKPVLFDLPSQRTQLTRNYKERRESERERRHEKLQITSIESILADEF